MSDGCYRSDWDSGEEPTSAEIAKRLHTENDRLRERIAELERLTHYFPRNNGHPNAGSEVDRLREIIAEIDKIRIRALKERAVAIADLNWLDDNYSYIELLDGRSIRKPLVHDGDLESLSQWLAERR